MSPTPRPAKTFRGSKHRLGRIKLHGNWTIEIWVLILVVLLALLIVVPWLIRHPPDDHRSHVTERARALATRAHPM